MGKKKINRKLLLCIAAAAGVLAVFLLVWAVRFFTADFRYETYSDHVVITKYRGNDKEVEIPSEIGGKPVTEIGASAFWQCSGLTSVEIPDSVTKIDAYAFGMCNGLISVTIPEHTTVSETAFDNCPNVVIIRAGSENGAMLADDSDTSQESEPDEEFPEATPVSSFEYGTKNGTTIITKYIGQEAEVVIPREIEGCPVVKIDNNAFWDCYKMTGVIIPDSVTELGESAFEACSSLTSVTIPDGVTSIPRCAFNRCGGLTSVTIPEGVTSIGRAAFSNCDSLTNIIIPDSVTVIDEFAFSECSNLTEVIIPEHTEIAPNAFAYSPNVTVNEAGVADMSQQDIAPKSLFNYWINENHVLIYEYVGQDTVVMIPQEIEGYPVTSLDNGVFRNRSSLTSVTIPDSVTSIGGSVFEGCSGLTSVTIPDSVTSISSSVFKDCSGLTSVTIPDSVTGISDSAFKNCSGLTNMTIPDSVTSIGSSAFSGCSGLTSVTIPNGVKAIKKWTFKDCSSLTSVVIPDSVTEINEQAFGNCSNLINVIIPEHTAVAENAFIGCPFVNITRASSTAGMIP